MIYAAFATFILCCVLSWYASEIPISALHYLGEPTGTVRAAAYAAMALAAIAGGLAVYVSMST